MTEIERFEDCQWEVYKDSFHTPPDYVKEHLPKKIYFEFDGYKYKNEETQNAWETWQACAEIKNKEIANLIRQLDTCNTDIIRLAELKDKEDARVEELEAKNFGDVEKIKELSDKVTRRDKRIAELEEALNKIADEEEHRKCYQANTNKPKIVTMCGSTRFIDVMAVCSWLIERDEHAITMGLHLLPGWYTDVEDHLAEHEGFADSFNELHLRKIDISDEIFVVNCNDYYGDDTAREIKYAKERGIKIRWFTHDPIGETFERWNRKSKK